MVLEDIVSTNQRSKIVEYDDCIFLALKMMFLIQFEIVLAKTKGRIRGLGSDYLLYALIDSVVTHYYAIIETMGNKIEDLEDHLFEGLTKDEISSEIQSLKREVLKVRLAIFPLREIINPINKSESRLINEKKLHYFSDVYDHIVQMSDTTDIYREMIWGLMDMYITTISNRMNEVMKVLTIIATIFIPITFISGIYGVNFDNIPELHYKYSYQMLLTVMLIIFLSMLYYFKRKKWL
ncbi:magnesium/cobalt transporter CorA [Lacinutrix jangbogonensis]|uniref:magnesium/cobalt transporter CorA n=1 Tax=Lacinutrix jangbogonensis TaxID=1469557 RepID=UPI000AAF7336|nr:magnesium/cobalt transporter CorA [Lacinutrix jangbogonensis]